MEELSETSIAHFDLRCKFSPAEPDNLKPKSN
jgi:hypothetical protein